MSLTFLTFKSKIHCAFQAVDPYVDQREDTLSDSQTRYLKTLDLVVRILETYPIDTVNEFIKQHTEFSTISRSLEERNTALLNPNQEILEKINETLLSTTVAIESLVASRFEWRKPTKDELQKKILNRHERVNYKIIQNKFTYDNLIKDPFASTRTPSNTSMRYIDALTQSFMKFDTSNLYAINQFIDEHFYVFLGLCRAFDDRAFAMQSPDNDRLEAATSTLASKAIEIQGLIVQKFIGKRASPLEISLRNTEDQAERELLKEVMSLVPSQRGKTLIEIQASEILRKMLGSPFYMSPNFDQNQDNRLLFSPRPVRMKIRQMLPNNIRSNRSMDAQQGSSSSNSMNDNRFDPFGRRPRPVLFPAAVEPSPQVSVSPTSTFIYPPATTNAGRPRLPSPLPFFDLDIGES